MMNCPVTAAALIVFSATAAAAQGSATPQTSAMVQPALNHVAAAGSGVDLNKWKGNNSARAEVDANLASMQKDLQTTLPPLLAAADAAPASAAASLPVLLNLDALYSVLLRVVIASRTEAPKDQNNALEQAATWLDGARRDLGNQVATQTAATEKHVHDLEAALKAQQATPVPVAAAPAFAPVTPAKKKVPAKRKAATTPAAAPAPAPKPQ